MSTKKVQSIVSADIIHKSNVVTRLWRNAFWSPLFAQYCLPHRKVNGSVWEIKNENITLKTASGYEIPYGAYPRLLLSYVTLQVNPPQAKA